MASDDEGTPVEKTNEEEDVAKQEEDSLKSALHSFASAFTNTSTKQHIQSTTALIRHLKRVEDIPEAVIRGISRVVVGWATTHVGHKSVFRLLSELFSVLSIPRPDIVLKHLSAAIAHSVKSVPNASISVCHSYVPIATLFTSILVSSVDDSLLKDVVEALGALAFYICTFDPLPKKFGKRFINFIKVQGQLRPELILSLSEHNALGLLSLLARCPGFSADDAFFAFYGKAVLLAKTAPPSHIIDACRFFLRLISRPQLEQVSAKKALLRSPEVALSGVHVLIASLPFESDFLVDDLLKTLLECIKSEKDEVREGAILVCVDLVKNVQPSNALKVLKGMLSQVLKSPDHRVFLLKEIGGAVLKGDADDALIEAATALSNTSGEVNETIVRASFNSALSLLENVNDHNKILTFIKDSLKKKVTGPSRVALFRSIALLVTKKVRNVPEDVGALLVSELNQKEPVEMLHLSHIILTIFPTHSDHYRKTFALVSGNDALIKDKVLTSLRDEDVLVLLLLSEQLCVSEVSPLALRAAALASIWRNHLVRKQAHTVIRRLAQRIPGFGKSLLHELYVTLENGYLDQMSQKLWSSVGEQYSVPATMLTTVLSLFLVEGWDYETLALPALLLACTSRIVEEDGSIWLRVCARSASVKEWLGAETVQRTFSSSIFSCADMDVRSRALRMLCALGIPSLKQHLWKELAEQAFQLDAKQYLKVTEDDVTVWKTPDGTLCHVDVLDVKESNEDAKMRRENKAYSYKEQKAEMELRREIAEKMKREGKLTAKQKEAMNKQLRIEKETREHLQELHEQADQCLRMLSGMVEADPDGLTSHMDVLDRVLLLLQSPLVAQHAAAFLISAIRFSFRDDPICALCSSASLRVLRSKWTDAALAREPLTSQVNRLLTRLYERVFVVETGEENPEEAALLYEDALGANHLVVLLPLLAALLDGDYPEDTVQRVLDLLLNAINRRLALDNSILILPVGRILRLLVDFAIKTEVAQQSTAALAVVDKVVSLVNETGQVTEGTEDLIRTALDYVHHENEGIRYEMFKALCVSQFLNRHCSMGSGELAVLIRLVVLCTRFDPSERVAQLASELWTNNHFVVGEPLLATLLEWTESRNALVGECAGQALRLFLQEQPQLTKYVIDKIKEMYYDLCELRQAEIDSVGRMTRDVVDEWQMRLGVARAAFYIAPHVDEENAMHLIHLVVPRGLNDSHPQIRDTMCSLGVECVSLHGATKVSVLLPLFEKTLLDLPDGLAHDNLRQGLIVLLGTLARYVQDQEKVRSIVARLVDALSTPSQKVQEAVALCLAPLVGSIPNAHELLRSMETVLFEGKTYGERRGAAYGISGMVGGLGLKALREHNLIANIRTSLIDKNTNKKQGGLLGVEMLATALGRLFEPFLLTCLSGLLLCFGDSSDEIRRSAGEASRAAMARLSSHGIKCFLPKILDALDSENWRTKCAAVELLSAMCWCAPRQLSSCLPTIVPKLIEVLADSHTRVQASGERALKSISRVVQNPEILGVSAQIMEGLIDPSAKTSRALTAIVNTKFIHYIDAASLALVMPIIKRAFQDRNSDTRKVAAQIISNIYKLAEDKDMEPYLADLVPGLQKSLMDPVPEIRTVSARALGAVVSRSRENTNIRDQIIPWLKEKLVCEESTVDRSGAAQGLSEVLAGVGPQQLEYVMPEIIEATESTEVSAETRDGYILMYIYLPMVFGDAFAPFLNRVLPSILRALADENEYVRSSALKAGQRLIAQFVSHARKLLLPQLQSALHDENWRIRHAAVTLIGDFLFNISGISGKSTSDTSNEDDTMGMEQAGKAITRALGQKCRDDVIAGLYLARSDVSLQVRQAASHVWKMIVGNTPRTLKEIMKTLFEKVLASLASPCEESQQTAARCLGELVRKMGEKIILEVLPVLDEYLDSTDVEKKVGVAVALDQIIANMSKEVLQHFSEHIVVPLRRCLTDPSEQVRSSAASTFTIFHSAVGVDAYDDVVGPLLESLPDGKSDTLQGLCAIMQNNSKHMLPFVLPRLTKKPVKVHALCALAAASGDALSKQLTRILDALMNTEQNDQYDPMIDACEEVILSVADEEGAVQLIQYLIRRAEGGNVPATVLLHSFLEKTELDLEEETGPIITGCLGLYAADHPQIADHAILALHAHIKRLEATQLLHHIPAAKKAIGALSFTAKGAQLKGFDHAKGLNPIVLLLREGILQGSVEMKQLSAECLGQAICVSTAQTVRPHVVAMTGPLIRVLGDRFPAPVKQAILQCLCHLLDKVDVLLRPFLPQLQSTFLKALQEQSSRQVRLLAAGALGRLVRFSPKPEPLLAELNKAISTGNDLHLLESTLVAARCLIANASSLSDALLSESFAASQVPLSVVSGSSDLDECIVLCCGGLAGQAAARLGTVPTETILEGTRKESATPNYRPWAATALQQLCRVEPTRVLEWGDVRGTISVGLSGPPEVAAACVRAAAYILMAEDADSARDLIGPVARAINHNSVVVRKVVGVAFGKVFAQKGSPSTDVLKLVVPHLVNGTKESNSAVRNAAELALVYAFDLQKDETILNSYMSLVEGAARDVLVEVSSRLKRVVKGGDIAVDTLENILAAP